VSPEEAQLTFGRRGPASLARAGFAGLGASSFTGDFGLQDITPHPAKLSLGSGAAQEARRAKQDGDTLF
jgi:hypothetical protein